MKNVLHILVLFLIMGLIYMSIEILYKGNTYLAMGIIGGIDGVLIGLINKVFKWETPLWIQCFWGMCIITLSELISGLILNLWLGLNYWDYSNLPYNFLGQICLQFTIAWYFLSLLGIFLDDFLRWKLFGEEKPHYRIF